MPDEVLFQEVKTKKANVPSDKRSPYRKQMLMPNNLEIERSESLQQQSQPDYSKATVKGTCTNLEKPYFRLTSAPDPADVRPEEVLEKSLKLMSKKWKKKQNDYRYIDEQFRSMRQDLTVQRIQSSLAIQIYETHARIALEQADLDQFNQCQTQLHYMYLNKIEGGHPTEFLAYKILYQIFCGMEMETLRVMKQLTESEKTEEAIKHALEVRKALATGNYGRFFKLFRNAPNMGFYLMDVFVEKHRILCLQKLAFATINSNIKTSRLASLLAFEDEKCLV